MLPTYLVLVVVLQNLVRPFLLQDHCCVLLLLRYLAEFGLMVGLQAFPANFVYEQIHCASPLVLWMGEVPDEVVLEDLCCHFQKIFTVFSVDSFNHSSKSHNPSLRRFLFIYCQVVGAFSSIC